MNIRVIKEELNRTILTQGGNPVLVGAAVRTSTTSPCRLKVALATPIETENGKQLAALAEFRLEMN